MNEEGGLTPNDVIAQANASESSKDSKATTEAVNRTTEEIKGLTDQEKSLMAEFKALRDSLGPFQLELFNRLTQGDEENRKAQEAAANAITSGLQDSAISKDDSIAPKPQPTKSDLMKLSGKWALGPLLLFSELKAIHNDLLKMFPNSNKKQKPKDLESESKGKEFKIGKISGIPDMAKAMKDFALGMLVMKIVNKKMVEGAIDIMAYAVTKWNELSNSMKGNEKRWADLNGLISTMGSGIKEMVLGMLILAISFPIILLAIPSALALVAFLNIIGLAGKASKMSFKGIKNLAFASLLMAAAFGAFAAVMWFIGKFVTPYLPSAIVGLAAISFVIGYTAYLGKMTKAQARNFMMFAGGAIMIGAAYALFGLTMMMIANAGLKFPLVLAGLAVIWYLLNDAQLQGKKVGEASGDFLKFAAGMALLGIAYMAFGKAMSILADVGVVGALKAIPGLAIIYFVIQFSKNVAEEIKNCTTDFIIFAAGMVLLGVAYMAFGVAMNILAQLPFGKIPVIAASMAMIFLIIWGTSKIASEIKDNMANFIMFAAGCIVMAIAYMAFGLVINIMAALQGKVLQAIPALIVSIVMLGISVALAKVVQNAMTDFVMFAVGCVILAIAYMAFGLVLKILGSFSLAQLGMAVLAVGLITVIMVLAAVLGAVITNTGAILYILAFALAAAALSVALLIFSAALLLLAKIGEISPAVIGMALANLAITLFGLVTLIPAVLAASMAMPFLMTIGLMLPIALLPLTKALKQLSEIGETGDGVIKSLVALNLLLGFIKGVGLGVRLLAGALALKTLSPVISMAISALETPLKNLADIGNKYSAVDVLNGTLGIGIMIKFISSFNILKGGKVLINALALAALAPVMSLAIGQLSSPLGALAKIGQEYGANDVLAGALGITVLVDTIASLNLNKQSKALVNSIALLVVAPIIKGALFMLKFPLADLANMGKQYPVSKVIAGALGISILINSVAALGLANIALASVVAVSLIGFASIMKVASEYLSTAIKSVCDIGDSFSSAGITKGLFGIWQLLNSLIFLNVPLARRHARLLEEAAIPFGNAVSVLSSAMEDIKNINENFGESTEKLVEMFNAKSMLNLILNLSALGIGINEFGKHLGGTNISKFKMFSQALNNITQADAAIDKLLQFAQNSDAFKEIAVSFESMANSLERIASKDRKVKSIFDTLSKAKTDINIMPESTPQAIGGTTFDPAVLDIYNVMNKWDKEGVPVKANINEETLQITPENVNNRTGALKVRNAR